MQVDAYLFFNGNCEEALEFYKNAFGGELEINRYEGSPMADQAPAGWGNKVMHATLRDKDGALLMASDSSEKRVPGNTVSLCTSTNDESEADAVFAKLGSGGTVTVPLEKTFWGAKFGMVTDKYGITWMVNCQLSEEPAATR